MAKNKSYGRIEKFTNYYSFSLSLNAILDTILTGYLTTS